jgi:hypothetical protein
LDGRILVRTDVLRELVTSNEFRKELVLISNDPSISRDGSLSHGNLLMAAQASFGQ